MSNFSITYMPFRGHVRSFDLRVPLLSIWSTIERVLKDIPQKFTGSVEPMEPVLTRTLPLIGFMMVPDNLIQTCRLCIVFICYRFRIEKTINITYFNYDSKNILKELLNNFVQKAVKTLL